MEAAGQWRGWTRRRWATAGGHHETSELAELLLRLFEAIGVNWEAKCLRGLIRCARSFSLSRKRWSTFASLVAGRRRGVVTVVCCVGMSAREVDPPLLASRANDESASCRKYRFCRYLHRSIYLRRATKGRADVRCAWGSLLESEPGRDRRALR